MNDFLNLNASNRLKTPSSDALSRYLTSGYLNHCAAAELGQVVC
ncbi:hypothetical protein ABWED_2248 [Acinetobacter lwoffii]|nr:hypothetical protein ABEKA_3119 [Acinetobacter lwoffii]UVB01505.1 hypothetical protein ABWED_2248 [Acinetobacter lwoffii]